MPLPPPWFARVLPGIGMAVTAAYVGYEIYKHLQPQHQHSEEEETIQLSRGGTITVDSAAADAEERSQLCKWLELPYDALDHVPANRLNVCLVLLQEYIPAPARVAFLAVFCDKMETDHDIELLSVLLESMTEQQHDGSDSATEQTVVLLKQTEQPVEIILHTLEVCPAEQRPILLNRLYILWNTNQLDTLLMQLPYKEPTRLFPIVEALVQTREESTVVFVEVLVCLHNDPERLSGFVRALRITEQRDVLLHKLSGLSMERLQQVTLCCAKFADSQVQSMVDTLITTTTVPPTKLSYVDHPSSTSSVVSSIVNVEDDDNASILS